MYSLKVYNPLDDLQNVAFIAAKSGNIEKLEHIFKNSKFSVNKASDRGVYPVTSALGSHDTCTLQKLDSMQGQILQLFIQKGADLNLRDYEQKSLLLQFIKGFSEDHEKFETSMYTREIVEFMFQNGSRPSGEDLSLAYAINQCSYDICETILKYKVDYSTHLSYKTIAENVTTLASTPLLCIVLFL